MFEDYFSTVPDIDAYFSRLGMPELQIPDEESLDRLIYVHQCRIPFENINPVNGLPVSLRTEDLFEKVIVGKRGGFCFELNTLFCRLLEACGFQVYGCRARVVRGLDYIPRSHHRGNIVVLDGEPYYCDVGYGGPQPAMALKVEDGFTKTAAGDIFRITKADAFWWTLSRAVSSGWENILQFSLHPELEADFITPCYYCASSPDSKFVTEYNLNLRTEGGSISLLGKKFIKREHGRRSEKSIETPSELRRIIETEFGISPGFELKL